MSLAWLENIGGLTSTAGTTITSSVTADTKGTAVSLGTSSGAATALVIKLGLGTQNRSFLVDIGVDEAGGTSYTYFITDMLYVCADSSTSDDQQQVATPCLPMTGGFASGSQFAMRCQDDTGSSTLNGAIELYSGTTDWTLDFVESMGVDASTNSLGTTVDPGATVNTKGAWAPLVASASGDMDFLVPVVGPVHTQTTNNGGRIWMDYGVGASTSEVAVIGNTSITEHIDECKIAICGGYEVAISSTDRVSARCQSSRGTSGRREVSTSLLGFKRTASGGGATWFAGE